MAEKRSKTSVKASAKAKNYPKMPIFLTIEDEEGFDGGLPEAIVPIVFSKCKNKIEGECYFGAYPVLRTFLEEYRENPFSKEALTALDRRLTPYLSEIGYERGSGILRYYRSFVLWDEEKLNTTVILPSSQLLTKQLLKNIEKNQTDFDLSELLSRGLTTAVTVENGELRSLCTLNPHSPGQRLLELTVYTLPSARGKGYGSSNTALLAKTLLEKKKGCVYVCSCRNTASLRLAKRLGFESESRFYAIDAYKK